MQISSIVDIVGGELLNLPSISFVTQIHTNINKINEGDLFIATCQEDIDIALSNGAFAIIFDFKCWMNDTEIAWIKVDNIKLSAIKLLRFLLSTRTIKSNYCDNISFDLLNIFSSKEQNYIFLLDDIIYDFELINKDLNINHIFSRNKEYIQSLLPLSKKFAVLSHNINNLIKHSLFTTTFSFNDQLFQKIKLSSLFIDQFLSAVKFYNYDIDLTKLKYFQHFKPIFINKYGEIVEFGKSNKFIIAKENQTKEEILFLKKEYSYANIMIIDELQNDSELFQIIKKSDANAIYIVGKSATYIENLLSNSMKDSLSLSF